MIVLSYGMTKSGSTLAFELCKSILQQKGFEQRKLPEEVVAPGHHINFLSDLSVPALARVMQEVAPQEMIVLKLHTPIERPEMAFIESAIAAGEMRLQVNLRDPREICLSLIDAGAKARENERVAFSEIADLEDAIKVVNRQLAVCRRWGAIKGATYLLYNEVAFETPRAVRQICGEFGFPMFAEEELKTVLDRVFVDAFTQKNKAVRDRFKDDLTVRQNEYLLENLRGGQNFIRKVYEKRDFSWFGGAREGAEDALAAA